MAEEAGREGLLLPARLQAAPSPAVTPGCFLSPQIVGNGSEQQLQKELEDILMDPPLEDPSSDRGSGAGGPLRTGGEGDEPVLLEASASSTVNPVSVAGPQKPEMILPVQPAQGGEAMWGTGGGVKVLSVAPFGGVRGGGTAVAAAAPEPCFS